MGAITPGWGSQWETLVTAINDYYGGGISSGAYQQITEMLNTGNYTVEEMESILHGIPEFTTTYNANGELINVSYKATANATNATSAITQEINSNVANATKAQFSTTQTITKEVGTDVAKIGDDVTKYSGGTATTGKVLTSKVIPAILAASAGITIGKSVDQLAYDSGFNWLEWAGVDMEMLNPEVWGTVIAGENTFGEKLINFLVGVNPDNGNPQIYMDENSFAYLIAYMGATGVLQSKGDYIWNGDTPTGFDLIEPIKHNETAFVGYVNGDPITCYSFGTYWTGTMGNIMGIRFIEPNTDYKVTSGVNSSGTTGKGLICSKSDFTDTNFYSFNPTTMEFNGSGTTAHGSYTHNYKTVYYTYCTLGTVSSGEFNLIGTAYENFDHIGQLAWVLQYGDFDADGIPGINDQPGAKVFIPTGISDYSNISAILDLLKNQYPELWDNRIEVSPNGDTVIKYIPVGFPTGGTGDKPTTDGATQKELAPDIDGDGENATDELIKTLIDLIQNPATSEGMEEDTETPTQPVNPNPPDTGTGETPTVIIPTGNAKSLFAIYNPEQSELNSFGAWLWSPAFVDQLLKLFNDPMQSIIGLHKVFAPPTISGTDTIHVGYLDSGVSSKIVGSQYVTVPCGSVSLYETFGNVFDYDPYTEVNIYLPFIGIERLNVGDIMRASIEVVYHVDVITGACLAEINVTRDLNKNTLYTYSGNCAVQYPISSGSYMGIVASIASIAGGVVGTIASGGALAPVALGAVNGALSARTRVEHSGGFSGNAGAMGIKKPYLIITRPQTALADTFPTFNGYPANKSVIISECSGFARFDEVHLENIPATSDELTEIESLLKSGIII